MSRGEKIFLASLVFASALADVSFGQKIEMVDGVRFVHNERSGKWGNQPRVKLELTRTIGGLDEQDVNLAFNAPYDIVLDSAGNMYILDTGNNRIQKLDPEGKFIKTIGRHGQGPGDLQSPFSLDIDDKDLLLVSEARNMRIQILNTEGKSLRLIRFKSPGIFQIRRLKSGLVAKAGRPSLRDLIQDPKKMPRLLEIIDINGAVKKSFAQARDYKDINVNSRANDFDMDIDKDDNIFLNFRYQNRVEKYSPEGILLWRADRPLNYTTDVIDKGSIRRDDKGTAVQGPTLNMVSHGIAADDKNRIWVNTLRRQMSPEEQGLQVQGGGRTRIIKEAKEGLMDVYQLEIFDRDGIFLGEIPLTHHVHGIRIFGDYLFVWERNNTTYYQYRIIEH